jgi:hypothetical protein
MLNWKARYDRTRGRKCWFLADAQGHDVTDAHAAETAAPQPAPTFSSRLASLFNSFSFTGTSGNATPASDAPKSNSPDLTRKHQSNATDANKKDIGVRANLKNNKQAAKQVSIPPESQDLYEEFLRWQAIGKTLNHQEEESVTKPNR